MNISFGGNLEICWFAECEWKERFRNPNPSPYPLASAPAPVWSNICWFTLNFHGGIKTHLHCKYYIEQRQTNHICFLLPNWTFYSVFFYVSQSAKRNPTPPECSMLKSFTRMRKICNEWLWRMVVGKVYFLFSPNKRINPQKRWRFFFSSSPRFPLFQPAQQSKNEKFSLLIANNTKAYWLHYPCFLLNIKSL